MAWGVAPIGLAAAIALASNSTGRDAVFACSPLVLGVVQLFRTRFAILTWRNFAIGASLVLVLGLLMPLMQGVGFQGHEGDRCKSNQVQIALGVLRYEDARNTYPAAFTCDAKGKRLHSWRTAILPWPDRTDLYEAVHQELPWNDERNHRWQTTLEVFICPTFRGDYSICPTSYVAIVGPGFAFQGDRPVGSKEFTDDRSESILFVESMSSDIGWMEPRDLEWQSLAAKPQPFLGLGPHMKRFTVTFADGHQRRLPDTISAERLHALLTIAGGEDMSWMQQPEETW